MMVRLLLFALLFFLAYTVTTAVFRLIFRGRELTPPPEKTRRGEAMVRDPQCGTYIPVGEAREKTIRGEKHYFCSDACYTAFRAGEKEK